MIRILEDIDDNKIKRHIANINKTWNYIRNIKREFDVAMDVICKEGVYDLELTFNEDELDEFYNKVYDVVKGKIDDVILSYNDDKDAKFNENFSLLFNSKINFLNLDKFIKSLIAVEEIDDFNDEDISEYVINNEISYDKFINIFKEYDDTGEYLISDLDKQLNSVLSEIQYQYDILDKIVDIYENIKKK